MYGEKRKNKLIMSRELSKILTSDQTPCKFIHCNSNDKLLIVIRFTRNKIGESPTHSSILLQIEPKCPNNNVLNLHTSCHSLCIIYLLLRSVYLYIVHKACPNIFWSNFPDSTGDLSRAKRSVHSNFEGHILPRPKTSELGHFKAL